MRIIQKIRDWLRGLNEHPDLSNTWEILQISDHAKFMDFLLSQATSEDSWQIDMVFTPATVEALRQFAKDGDPIPLTPDNVAALRPLLPTFDLRSDFVHHSIGRRSDFLLVSYDNLTCCWVSKRVGEETLTTAARECGFEYQDTGSA